MWLEVHRMKIQWVRVDFGPIVEKLTSRSVNITLNFPESPAHHQQITCVPNGPGTLMYSSGQHEKRKIHLLIGAFRT